MSSINKHHLCHNSSSFFTCIFSHQLTDWCKISPSCQPWAAAQKDTHQRPLITCTLSSTVSNYNTWTWIAYTVDVLRLTWLHMKFIHHTGQTIATTVIRTPTVEKKEEKNLQGINHTDSNTFSENSTNTTYDGANGHCITNIINEVQGINVISNHTKGNKVFIMSCCKCLSLKTKSKRLQSYNFLKSKRCM